LYESLVCSPNDLFILLFEASHPQEVHLLKSPVDFYPIGIVRLFTLRAKLLGSECFSIRKKISIWLFYKISIYKV